MRKETDKDISKLLSIYPESTLLVSSKSGDFIVEAVYNSKDRDRDNDVKTDEQLSVFKFLENNLGASTIWDTSYLNHFLNSILDKQKPEASKIVEINQKTDSGNRYIQLVGTTTSNSQGDGSQLLVIVRDVTDAVHFGAENKLINDGKASETEQQQKDNNLRDIAVKSKARFETTSKELDDFVYSVSHDLRAPLRRIDGFSQELIENYLDKLDEMGQHYLRRVRQGAQDMGNLIDDLLKLSRISRREVERSSVNMGEIAREIFKDLKTEIPERELELVITGDLQVHADQGLIKIVLTNLLSNAIKFTRNVESAIIEVGSTQQDREITFYVKDNGIGFDPAYSDKLFKAFQRLHSQQEYEGTGIGLVTVKRIINSHNGRVWAEGRPGEGAVIYFTLT